MSRRQRREFTEEFKLQMVQLYNNGKPGSEIIREYDLTPSAFNNWVKNIILQVRLKHVTIEQKKKMN